METEFFAEPLSRIANSSNTIAPTHQRWNTKSNFQETTLEEDLIRKCYHPAYRKTEKALFLTATEITDQLALLSKRVSVLNVGMALKKLGFERLHRGINGNQLKGYYVLPLLDSI